MKLFYVVLDKGSIGFTKDIRSDADELAKKMAQEHPDNVYYVMECVASVSTQVVTESVTKPPAYRG